MMEHVCRRCARQLLQSSRAHRTSFIPIPTRLLSSTVVRKAEDGAPSRPRHVDLSGIDETTAPRESDEAAYRKGVAKAEEGRHYKHMRPKVSYSALPSSQITAYDPQDNASHSAPSGGSQSGQVLQRSRPNPNNRSRESGNGGPGPVLRRSRPGPAGPQRPGARGFPRRDAGAAATGNVGGAGNRKNQVSRGRSRRGSPQEEKEYEVNPDDAANEELDPKVAGQFDRHFENVVFAEPGLPTQSVLYQPKAEQSDLERSWPNTPMSTSGTVASVSQKLGPLANRQARTHTSPLQLAEMYLKGELVSFHSEAEKEETMQFAKQLQDERADRANREPWYVPEYTPLSSSENNPRQAAEKNAVVSGMVQGKYPEPQKQKMPWMDSIVRQLRNNETYGPTDSAKFMARVQKMVDDVQRTQTQRKAPQTQKQGA